MQKTNQPLPPFSCTYSPNVPELLHQLHCTLAISTYQAGKVVFISAKDNEKLVQLPRTFHKAMGIGLSGPKMALATMDEVLVLVNSPDLAAHYPKQPNTYDALFMPRAAYFTGGIDIHDIDFGGDTIYAVNTSFSCLIKIDDNYSFTPVWKPPFITNLASEDRCHLNGMALENERPKYVTAFNQGNTFQSWREEVTTGGILMDIETNELVATGLAMPHSPRLFDGKLYLLLSATGELIQIDRQSGKYEVVNKLKGFVRGLARYGDYVFIGLSRLRKNSSTFAKLEIADQAQEAGISILHLPTGAQVGYIQYHSSVEEIYDVQILPNMIRPGILNTLKPEYKMGLSTPDTTYWARKAPE
ncbi:MAG: TIGR03032 family protein [Phaeodactylibacter sp.]|nr:TIGR03032 family protein [Phaeodactylibacter sp.]